MTVSRRALIVAPIVVHLAACSAGAQLHKIFPWFHRAEPAVERLVFVDVPEWQIKGKRVGILPFGRAQQGEPVPPPFAPFVLQALSQMGIAGALVDIRDQGELHPRPALARSGDADGVVAALDRSKAAGVELLVTGRLDALFRTTSGGMVIKVSAELWSVEHRIPVWSGRITLDWIRRYPIEDCLLRAAITLVEEWAREPKRK